MVAALEFGCTKSFWNRESPKKTEREVRQELCVDLRLKAVRIVSGIEHSGHLAFSSLIKRKPLRHHSKTFTVYGYVLVNTHRLLRT